MRDKGLGQVGFAREPAPACAKLVAELAKLAGVEAGHFCAAAVTCPT